MIRMASSFVGCGYRIAAHSKRAVASCRGTCVPIPGRDWGSKRC